MYALLSIYLCVFCAFALHLIDFVFCFLVNSWSCRPTTVRRHRHAYRFPPSHLHRIQTSCYQRWIDASSLCSRYFSARHQPTVFSKHPPTLPGNLSFTLSLFARVLFIIDLLLIYLGSAVIRRLNCREFFLSLFSWHTLYACVAPPRLGWIFIYAFALMNAPLEWDNEFDNSIIFTLQKPKSPSRKQSGTQMSCRFSIQSG